MRWRTRRKESILTGRETVERLNAHTECLLTQSLSRHEGVSFFVKKDGSQAKYPKEMIL